MGAGDVIMIAWSLSGGGNRGPLQVGAMRALFEEGITPGMLVGTSAGALNAAFLASDPTPGGIERLAQIWLRTRRQDIFPDGFLTQAFRFITGADGLNSADALRNYVLKNAPPGVTTFGDLKIKLFLTTADLQTGQLFLYGEDSSARVVDAVLSSSAMPIAWPPQFSNGHQYVDGGVVANVPISIAIDKGADVVYALDLESGEPSPPVHNVYNIAQRTISVMLYQQLLRDLERVVRFSLATLHHIYLGDLFNGLAVDDLTHTAEMIDVGYKRAKEYLAHPTPNKAERAMTAMEVVAPPGAVLYDPPLVQTRRRIN
jgi:NTE family protein